jgi:hypothetical protein
MRHRPRTDSLPGPGLTVFSKVSLVGLQQMQPTFFDNIHRDNT